ncbi:MAG TPA: response regulator [Pirellulales bacterium]|nr:response regulator [Pirellulales bacterium]
MTTKTEFISKSAARSVSESTTAIDSLRATDQVNILIVDDEPSNLTVLETVLNDPSYRMVRAQSGEECLLALLREDFALIILDIHMPGMSGFELAQMIKQRQKTAVIPIIFLTAYYSEDQHVLEGYGTGAVDYLHKPINATILRSKVSVFTELYRKTRECAIANDRLLAEVGERRKAQEELLRLNNELESRVDQRTAELLQAHAALGESEERLRLANEASGTGLWEWNLQSDSIHWSPECYTIYGLKPGEFDGTGEGFFNLVHSDDRGPIREAIATSVVDQTPFFVDFRVVRPDGCVRWVTARGRAYYDSYQQPVRMICTLIDITSRKEAEVVLRDADRQKDEFLAMLAHELRNPLAPIRNAAQILLLKGSEIPELQWAREVIDRQVHLMTRLVDDLLDVSRITTGKLELRTQIVDLAQVVRAAVETSLPLIERDQHQLSLSLPAEPVVVNADVIRLAEVFSNLLNNAAKYTERGGRIELRVEGGLTDAAISVKDSGIGISKEMLPRVFNLFTQVDRHLHRNQGGLGVGLTLARRLVEMHGGTIEAHSAGLNMGSEFIVRLPLISQSVSVPRSESEPSARPAAASRRVLVVDDNEDGAKTLAMMLRVMGHEIRTAHDGVAALEVAEVFRPEVILLDIGMPRMDGYEACRAIRQKPWASSIRIVALTGWGHEEDRRKTRDAGFDDHLTKPVDSEVLIGVFGRARG